MAENITEAVYYGCKVCIGKFRPDFSASDKMQLQLKSAKVVNF